MRFVVSNEMSRNRLLQVIVVLYSLYVALLWLTNALLYFSKMSLTYGSVVAYYLGSEQQFTEPRSYLGMLEVSHFHLFAMGMLLLVLTHLVLFVPLSNRVKIALIVAPFLSALLDEGSSWLVRFVSPLFAFAKIAGFLALQTSLAALVALSLWSAFSGTSENYRRGEPEDDEEEY
jgi:hypothetical protein